MTGEMADIYPDFVTIAKGFGVPSRRVRDPAELRGAIREMLDTPGPFLLDVMVPHIQHVLPMIPGGGSFKDIITKARSPPDPPCPSCPPASAHPKSAAETGGRQGHVRVTCLSHICLTGCFRTCFLCVARGFGFDCSSCQIGAAQHFSGLLPHPSGLAAMAAGQA